MDREIGRTAIIEETITLESMKTASVYNGCLSWLYHRRARAIRSIGKGHIKAYLQLGMIRGEDRETLREIDISLEEKADDVLLRITLSISLPIVLRLDSESGLFVKTVGENGFEKYREEEWPKLIEDLKKYLNEASLQLKPREVNVLSNVITAFKSLYTTRPVLTTVSEVIYEKPSPLSKAKSWGLVLISIILFSSFYVFYFWLAPTRLISDILYLIATYGVAILFLFWVHSNDRYEKEPWKLVILVFSWGVFSGIVAAPLNRLLGPYFEILGTQALVAAFVEEPAKAMGLYLFVRHRTYGKELNTPLDGIVYGFATGIGFFAMENFLYFLRYGFMNLFFRSLLCWGHGVYTATVGLWLAIGKIIRGRTKIHDILPGLLVAILLHFLWNGWGAWIRLLLGEEHSGFAGQIMIFQAIFMLGYLFRRIGEALRDETLWGYAVDKAPVESVDQSQ